MVNSTVPRIITWKLRALRNGDSRDLLRLLFIRSTSGLRCDFRMTVARWHPVDQGTPLDILLEDGRVLGGDELLRREPRKGAQGTPPGSPVSPGSKSPSGSVPRSLIAQFEDRPPGLIGRSFQSDRCRAVEEVSDVLPDRRPHAVAMRPACWPPAARGSATDEESAWLTGGLFAFEKRPRSINEARQAMVGWRLDSGRRDRRAAVRTVISFYPDIESA